MVRLPATALPEPAASQLTALQLVVDSQSHYAARIAKAKSEFRLRNVKTNPTFKTVRETLAAMCRGAQRCAYCEDSAADEVEHIKPKHLFPERVFVWDNYLFACGPCNGPKNTRFAVFDPQTGGLTEIGRLDTAGLANSPPGDDVMVNPRKEDPLLFLELDLVDTFEFLPAFGTNPRDRQRALYTRDILRLNKRDYLIKARRNAFGSYVARLKEYIAEKGKGASADALLLLVNGIQNMEHQSVWCEMQRQQQRIPLLKALFADAPEALSW
jgi:hypothetical protein